MRPLFLLTALCATPALAAPVQPAPWLASFGTTTSPIGHEMFCRSAPGECRAQASDAANFGSAERLDELLRVNREVNRRIAPMTDLDLYGMIEYWTVPTRRGDCEDYVLLKRRVLIAAGWSARTLLITVVRDENNEGHAVLVARMPQGDLVLDNKIDAVQDWRRSRYTFVKQQSPDNPRLWLSLLPQPLPAPIAASGRR